MLGERTLSWGVARVRGVELGLEAFDLERRGGGTLLAGGLAYRLFFWLLPLGLTVAALLAFWQEADPDGIDEAAQELGMGAAAARSASQAISDSTSSRWYFLLAGLWFTALLLAAASFGRCGSHTRSPGAYRSTSRGDRWPPSRSSTASPWD